MKDVLLEEVFRLLEEATRLEKSGQHRIEAATKYYESCYLMRQILATATESSESNSIDDNTSIGQSSRHLLEAKIDHYTKIARKLYFDEGTILDGPQNQQQRVSTTNQEEQSEQAPTSVIISLLGDTLSVITEHHTLPPPIAAHAIGYERRVPMRPRNNMSSPSAPVVYTTSPKMPTKCTRINTNYPEKQSGYFRPKQQQSKQLPKQQQQKQLQPNRWNKTPAYALSAIEQRIHQRTNHAHSRLSKAVDLDELHSRLSQSDDSSQARAAAIATYVEASELYLSAIHMNEDQKTMREEAEAASPAKRKFFPKSQTNLVGKLKQLVVSALDRVEALKKEEAQYQRQKHQHEKQQSFDEHHCCNRYETDIQNHASAVASSIMATPIATEISRSIHRCPFPQWNVGRKDFKGYAFQRRSPTTIVLKAEHR